jgi:hypothetical protein
MGGFEDRQTSSIPIDDVISGGQKTFQWETCRSGGKGEWTGWLLTRHHNEVTIANCVVYQVGSQFRLLTFEPLHFFVRREFAHLDLCSDLTTQMKCHCLLEDQHILFGEVIGVGFPRLLLTDYRRHKHLCHCCETDYPLSDGHREIPQQTNK